MEERLNEKQYFDLGGLKLIFIAQILSLIGGLASGSISAVGGNNAGDLNLEENMSNTAALAGAGIASVIGGVLAIVALVLTIVGLHKVAKYSRFFKSARNMYYVTIGLMVLLMILAGTAMIGFFATIMADDGMPDVNNIDVDNLGLFAGVGLAAIIVAVLIFLVSILINRGLLYGLAEVSYHCAEDELERKCRKTFRLFMISVLFTIIAVVLIVAGAIGTEWNSITPGSFSGTSILMVIGLVVAIIALIISIVVTIQILVRIWKVYRRCNGKPIDRDAALAAKNPAPAPSAPAPAAPVAPAPSAPAPAAPVPPAPEAAPAKPQAAPAAAPAPEAPKTEVAPAPAASAEPAPAPAPEAAPAPAAPAEPAPAPAAPEAAPAPAAEAPAQGEVPIEPLQKPASAPEAAPEAAPEQAPEAPEIKLDE